MLEKRLPPLALLEYGNIAILACTAVVLVGLQLQAGWGLFVIGLVALGGCSVQFRKDFLLLYISLAILAVTKINTDISYGHFLLMGAEVGLAVGLPYCISRYVYGDYLVRFCFRGDRNWTPMQFLWIGITLVVSYFLVPFYLNNTGAYVHWTVIPDADHLLRLFIGTNGLGIWDELFFISTVLGILKRYLPFTAANITQAVLFTSFLYELGFTSWGFILVYMFALIQGTVCQKTGTLLYVITLHLTVDLVLFLAILQAHYPEWFHIFLF